MTQFKFYSVIEMMDALHQKFNYDDDTHLFFACKSTKSEIIDFIYGIVTGPFAYKFLEEINPYQIDYEKIDFSFLLEEQEVGTYALDDVCEGIGFTTSASMDDGDFELFTPVLSPLLVPKIRAKLEPLNIQYLKDCEFEKEYNRTALEATMPDAVKKLFQEYNISLGEYSQIPYINWFVRYLNNQEEYNERKLRQVFKHAPRLREATSGYGRKRLENKNPFPENYKLRMVRHRLDKEIARADDASLVFQLLRPLCYGDLGADNFKKMYALFVRYVETLLYNNENFLGYHLGNAGYTTDQILQLLFYKYDMAHKLQRVDINRLNNPIKDVYDITERRTVKCEHFRPGYTYKRRYVTHRSDIYPESEKPKLRHYQKIVAKHEMFLGGDQRNFCYDIQSCLLDEQPRFCVETKRYCPYADFAPSVHSPCDLKQTTVCNHYYKEIPEKINPEHKQEIVTLTTYVRKKLPSAAEIIREYKDQIQSLIPNRNREK